MSATLLKRLTIFQSPARMSLPKLCLAGSLLISPSQGEFGKWHPGWGWENHKPFFTVYSYRRTSLFFLHVVTKRKVPLTERITEKYWWARVFWPLLWIYHPFCILKRCLDSNPDSCCSKQARYQLRHLSPSLNLYLPSYTFKYGHSNIVNRLARPLAWRAYNQCTKYML